MTGRERLIRVLSGDKVDRVPVVPFFYNNFINEFCKSSDVDPVEKGIEIYEYFGFDIILRTCNEWEFFDETECDSKNWRVSELKDGDQNEWTIITTIRTPEKELVQKKRYNRATENEVLEAVVEYYIKDEEDFEQFVKYQPPLPECECRRIKQARKLLGDKGLAAPWAQGAFNSVSFYRKLDDLILDPYINPDFYKKMMAYFSGRMLEVIGQFAKAGADIICCGGNVANSTMVGPNHFRDYILPYEAKFTKKAKDYGLFYLYHNCGDAKALLDYYSKINMNIYESLTPPPYGDTLLEDAIGKFDKNITLCGNIDQIGLLRNASLEKIREVIRSVLDLAKQRGNFILATTDYICEGTPYENIRAFAEAGIKFGRY